MKYAINHEFVSISSQTATHRIILMHGWGADSDDLLTFGKEMTEKINLDFEVISLRAPGLHPSGQGRQWYGLYPHDWNGAEVEVNKLLVTLKKFDTDQIPLRKTILLGFSQGPIDASRTIYEKVKSKSSKFCELLEFDGFHQIDSNLINFISSNISNIF